MSFKAPQNSLDKKKSLLWRRRSFNRSKSSSTEETQDNTLPRRRTGRSRSASLVDYTDPSRTVLMLEKQDNQAFGFDVQTYGLQVRSSVEVEMCTFVCRVQCDGAAEAAGLTAGDIILSVNGVSIEGSSHQQIIEMIRQSTNLLRLETVSGSVVKRIELEKKMQSLKQTLREKLVELQTLTLQERRIARGDGKQSCQRPSEDSLMSMCSPTTHSSLRFSSDSSMTDDGFGCSVFEDASPFSPVEPSGRFFCQDAGPSRPLTRTQSVSLTNCNISPSWENSSSSVFGTLPRRARKVSVRKQLLKFVPGLNHSVEEEEAG